MSRSLEEITNFTTAEDTVVRLAGVEGLPNSPSGAGIKASDLKKRFYQPLEEARDDIDDRLTKIQSNFSEIDTDLTTLEGLAFDKANIEQTVSTETTKVPSSNLLKNELAKKVNLAGNESITGIKTYETGATPLITDQPTTNLMAANKLYVDTQDGLKVNTSAIKTAVSETPSDDNLLSEKFINTTYATKADIASVFEYKGTVADYTALSAITGQGVGDTYNMTASYNNTPAGTNWAWNGSAWDALGGDIIIETSQSTSAVKVPSSNLLTQSSFARVYRSLADLGLTAPVYMSDIITGMTDTSQFVSNVSVTTDFFKYKSGEAVLPANYGILTITMRGSRARIEYSTSVHSSINKIWFCDYSPTDTLVRAWKLLIDDSSAQTISAIKTYSVSPLVPTTPSGPSAAVNKTYVTAPPDNITMAKAEPQYALKNTDIVVGTLPTENKLTTFGFLDNSNNNCGYTQYRYFPNGTIEILIACNSHNTPNSRTVGVAIGTDISNNTYFTSNNNGQTDLGRSTLKWKDIHFSGALKKNGTDINALEETISAIKTFATGATPLITDAPTTDLMAVNKAYCDSRLPVYDKVIRTQAEFNALIASATWLDAKSVAFVGAFTLSAANNGGVKIPATVKQIHGFNSAKITITNFKYNSSTAKGGLWYDTAPTTRDYSIRDLEVSCTGDSGRGFYNCINLSNGTGTGTGTAQGLGFASCNNLSNCTGTGTGENARGFSYCNNLSNCTGKGTGTTSGYGFDAINYAVNCKDDGSSTNMWVGTNKNIDLDTCVKNLGTASNTTLNA